MGMVHFSMSFEKQTNLLHVDSKPPSTSTKTLGPEELRGNPFFSLACGNYGLKDQLPGSMLGLRKNLWYFNLETCWNILKPWLVTLKDKQGRPPLSYWSTHEICLAKAFLVIACRGPQTSPRHSGRLDQKSRQDIVIHLWSISNCTFHLKTVVIKRRFTVAYPKVFSTCSNDKSTSKTMHG